MSSRGKQLLQLALEKINSKSITDSNTIVHPTPLRTKRNSLQISKDTKEENWMECDESLSELDSDDGNDPDWKPDKKEQSNCDDSDSEVIRSLSASEFVDLGSEIEMGVVDRLRQEGGSGDKERKGPKGGSRDERGRQMKAVIEIGREEEVGESQIRQKKAGESVGRAAVVSKESDKVAREKTGQEHSVWDRTERREVRRAEGIDDTGDRETVADLVGKVDGVGESQEDGSDNERGQADVEIEMQVDHEEQVYSQDEMNKIRAKKGMVDPKKWQRNHNKQLRMEGRAYKGIAKIDGKKQYCVARNERILGERGCSKRCEKTRKCGEIKDRNRQEIFRSFWNNMDWKEKKIYVANLVQKCYTVSSVGENSRRKFTFKYFLKIDQQRIAVCKNLFLSTLGIGEYTVYEWLKSIDDHGLPETRQDARMRQKAPESLQNSYARQFLMKLTKMPSHYCRASTTKQYLEPIFTSFAELHRIYQQNCAAHGKLAISRKVLLKLFDELNLALYQPKKDQCDICIGHETGNVSDEDHSSHINRKESARAEKVFDKERAIENNKIKVSTMDLQSVLICPSLQASAIYYKTKLACHNFTTHDLATKDVNCYFWHEGEGSLSSHNFATCITHYLEALLEPGLEEIILFSDGCGYQNRNASLSNALLYSAVKNNVIITQKYLEKGHTQMEVDSVHSTLERKFRKVPIYSPANYAELMRQARPSQPYIVNYLTHQFFKDFSSLKYYETIRPGNRVGDPCVHDLRVLRYLPSGIIQFKLNFTDEFRELPRRRNSNIPSTTDIVASTYDKPLPIKRSKFDHLQQLKSVIPVDYHAFYDQLPYE